MNPTDTCHHITMETGPLQVNCHLFSHSKSGRAVLIDPGGDAPMLLNQLHQNRLKLTHILATHGHFDHIGAVSELQQETKCQFLMHEADHKLAFASNRHAAQFGISFGEIPHIDGAFKDGEQITFESMELTFQIVHTPGHTQGGVCFHWGNDMIVGDTLFAGSIGRTDLPGGNHHQLINSIQKRLLTLPDKTRLHPGHGPSSTVAHERRTNPFLISSKQC